MALYFRYPTICTERRGLVFSVPNTTQAEERGGGGGGGGGVRESERQTDGQTETQRERQRDRDRESQRDGERELRVCYTKIYAAEFVLKSMPFVLCMHVILSAWRVFVVSFQLSGSGCCT